MRLSSLVYTYPNLRRSSERIELSILCYGRKFQGFRAICSVERKKLQEHVERTPEM